MAAALELKATLPNALQYQWISDGQGDTTLSRTQQEMADDCRADSAIKAFLTSATDANWTTKLTVAVPNTRNAVQTQLLTGETRRLQVQGRSGFIGPVVIEVRLK